MKNFTKSVLIAAAITATALAASAQGMMGEGHSGMGPKGGKDHARMEKMMASHLDSLKAKLKLSPEQNAAWATFANSMKPTAMSGPKHADMAEIHKLPTPERLDKMREMHKQRMGEMDAAMAKRDEAIKTFYNALNAEQKKVFDAEHARMDSGRKHHGHGPQDGSGKGPQAKP